MKALIFDCDGVLVDTEKDGHRVAFNRTFAEMGYDIEWTVELYGELLKISGGKERMKHYFNEVGWPETDDKDELIKALHKTKTDTFMKIIESGELALRPGVARLVDEAIADGDMLLAICSTSNERSVNLIAEKLLGPKRKAKFRAILAGDVVSKKKPDPEIYNLATQRLSAKSEECVVIEDSRNGLLSAKAAGMHCVITTTGYTKEEDFSEADLVVSELGDSPNIKIILEALKAL